MHSESGIFPLSCHNDLIPYLVLGRCLSPMDGDERLRPRLLPARLTGLSSTHIIWDCSNRCDCLNWACYNHICLFTPSLSPVQMHHCKIGDCRAEVCKLT